MNRFYAATTFTAITLAIGYASAGEPRQGPSLRLDERLTVAQQTNPAKTDAPAQDMAKRTQQMQEHMNQMQAQMEKIRQTSDPKERQKLMQEHLQSMRENMDAMHDLGGCMMMGRGGGRGQGATPSQRGRDCGMMMGADSGRNQQMMEQRLDMMQMMMEQMMQHQEASQAQPK